MSEHNTAKKDNMRRHSLLQSDLAINIHNHFQCSSAVTTTSENSGSRDGDQRREWEGISESLQLDIGLPYVPYCRSGASIPFACRLSDEVSYFFYGIIRLMKLAGE